MRKNIYRSVAACICIAALAAAVTACSGTGVAETTIAETELSETDAAETVYDDESGEVETADAPYAIDSSTAETLRGEEPITVEPLTNHLSIDGSQDCTFAAGFTPKKDIVKDGDIYMLSYTGYYYECYDLADMSVLKAGDTIMMGGEAVLIDTIENVDGIYKINGGLDEGGHDLITEGNTIYFERGYDDIRTYAKLGEGTLPIADDCVITDSADFEHPNTKLTIEELASNDDIYGFTEYNTMLVIEGGKITEITRSFTP